MNQHKFHDYGKGLHDSIQYHFFCENFFFATRVFRTDSIDHCSAWLFDGTTRENVVNSNRVQQTVKNFLDIKNEMLEFSVPDTSGVLKVRMNASDFVIVNFSGRHEFRWLDPGAVLGGATRDSVIHQPDLQCELKYRGKVFKGVGYCKRYTWIKSPRYCYWNFFHCTLVNHSLFLWTADAYFASKYNYFKFSNPEGNLFASDEKDTFHQADKAYGIVAGQRYELHFKQVAEWEYCILTDRMDGLMRERFGNVVLKCDGKDFDMGPGFHENFIGTIG